MMMRRIKTLLTALTLAVTMIAMPAWALSKDEAKAQGLIGERANGYLGVVTSKASPAVTLLVADINRKRKAAYQKSAASAGVERGVFELRMGQRLQDRTPAGQFIQLQNGNWKRK